MIRRSVQSLRAGVGSHDVGASSCRYLCIIDRPVWLFSFPLRPPLQHLLLGPPVEQHQPLLEGQSRFFEKCPTPQTHKLFTCVDWTSTPAVQYHNTYDECSHQSFSAVQIFSDVVIGCNLTGNILSFMTWEDTGYSIRYNNLPVFVCYIAPCVCMFI